MDAEIPEFILRSFKVKRLTPPLLRRRVLRRDNFQCVACGSPHAPVVDHIQNYGPATLDNLQTLCSSCNVAKGDKRFATLEAFREWRWERGYQFLYLKLPIRYYEPRVVLIGNKWSFIPNRKAFLQFKMEQLRAIRQAHASRPDDED